MDKMFTGNSIETDEHIFCELYAMYKNRLIYYAIRLVKSRELAEDIVQDAFISIWLNRKNIDTDQSISSYLFTIVHNRILNQLKNIDNELRLKEALLKNAVDYTTETENKLIEKDFENILNNLMLNLTPQQQRIFKMSRELRMSHKEIAEELGISLHTVNQHITEALQIIRSKLSKYPNILTDCVILFLLFNK